MPSPLETIVRIGVSESKTPIPKAFTEAFKDEPNYILDPTLKPSAAEILSYEVSHRSSKIKSPSGRLRFYDRINEIWECARCKIEGASTHICKGNRMSRLELKFSLSGFR